MFEVEVEPTLAIPGSPPTGSASLNSPEHPEHPESIASTMTVSPRDPNRLRKPLMAAAFRMVWVQCERARRTAKKKQRHRMHPSVVSAARDPVSRASATLEDEPRWGRAIAYKCSDPRSTQVNRANSPVVDDVIEHASSGRAKCRACAQTIAKDELRFGERAPNPFGEGEASYWFHLACAVCKRPEKAVAALEAAVEAPPDRESLLAMARRGVEHPRLARVAGAERSPSARAKCRHCREAIPKDAWRLPLDWWEDGRFGPSGSIHLSCAAAYFGNTEDLIVRIRRFAPELSESDVSSLAGELGQANGST